MKSSASVLIFEDDRPSAHYNRERQTEASPEPEAGAPCEVICGCFITSEGFAEPALPRVESTRGEDFEWQPWQPALSREMQPLSANKAFVHLHRCLAETGQFFVRTADCLTEVWFAGVGDPEILFVEMFARGDPAGREHDSRQWICPLGHAQKLLKGIYQGAGYAELCEVMAEHRHLRLPAFSTSDDPSDAKNLSWPGDCVAI